MGDAVKVPNKEHGDYVECLLSYDWPENLQEYDIVVVDLLNQKARPYKPEDHRRHEAKGSRQLVFLSSYPETLFDPRPAAAHFLGVLLRERNFIREFVLVIFAGPEEVIEYKSAVKAARGYENIQDNKWKLHDLIPEVPRSFQMFGMDVEMSTSLGGKGKLHAVLRRYAGRYKYHTLFEPPVYWDEAEKKAFRKTEFLPLLAAYEGLVASYFHSYQKGGILVLPFCESQEAILIDLLNEALPDLFPAVFPENAKFGWLSDPLYGVPGELALLREKEEAEQRYRSAIAEIDARIERNREEHFFLRQILTESGDELVASVACYLDWLGFPETRVVDQEALEGAIKSEDIQVDFPDGLLVIEVKGLAGTSTDADCSQVSKIRYRRAKERGGFDVLGLYIVNHERFKPPESRRNPPFTKEQIQDALNDDRGLLTTYQLFQLYFSIEDGLITKDDARKALRSSGLIEFTPSAAQRLGQPAELHYGNQVAILTVDVPLRIGDALALKTSGRLFKTSVVGLQVKGEDVEFVTSGEVGVKVGRPIPKGAEIWRAKTNA